MSNTDHSHVTITDRITGRVVAVQRDAVRVIRDWFPGTPHADVAVDNLAQRIESSNHPLTADLCAYLQVSWRWGIRSGAKVIP